MQPPRKKPTKRKLTVRSTTFTIRGRGTKKPAGAGMSRRNHVIEDEASSDSDERRRHTRGPLYERTNGTVYDESQLLSENYFFFDRAH